MNSRLPSQQALSALEALEDALRCQICKDLMTAPVITGCSHTFCSLCIRRVLVDDGRCPVCRHTEDEQRLRKNTAVEDAIEAYIRGRCVMSACGSADCADLLLTASALCRRVSAVPVSSVPCVDGLSTRQTHRYTSMPAWQAVSRGLPSCHVLITPFGRKHGCVQSCGHLACGQPATKQCFSGDMQNGSIYGTQILMQNTR